MATKLELRCKKNDDGTFDAHLLVNGVKDPNTDLEIRRGQCKHVRELYSKAMEAYHGKKPKIAGDCVECFMEDGEIKYPE